MDVFERYAPFIQDFIYDSGWTSLRGIEVAAGEAIFGTEENVLLTSSTASGKTEAAFFPIITMLHEAPPSSVGCLYIAPLKALINDQFGRLNELCERADIPVFHWHGDVSSSHKKKLLKHPAGILQITPESLEAMMIRRHGEICHLFGDLRFIVIDEIHSLLRGDRGGQALCLVERLSRLAGVSPRRIGLSATLGDPTAAGKFLSDGTGRGVVIPKVKSQNMRWHLLMEHFYVTPPQAADVGDESEKPALPIPATDTAPVAADPAYAYIFEHTRGKKCLVFSNSREECEAVTSTLRAYCEARHEPDRFLIHHGNLSTSFRESAEDAMRDDDLALTTCTTATLELGIDIGKLERAFQIDAPFTVSAFLQRMGRTGRRGDPEEMIFVMREEHPEPRALLPENVPWKLLQGIALVELYLSERWVEPPREGRLPYSLLYHQTMSALAAGGEMTVVELAKNVLGLAYFSNISREDFRELLVYLIENDNIQRTENDGLIVGLAGERIVNSFKFFAVFQENEEYTVRCDSQELGTIVKPPPVGDKIAIAGHVWVVEELDRKRRVVYCHPVKGRVPAYFGDCAGDIHTKILEKMRDILRVDDDYRYLGKNARARLASAREASRIAGITSSPMVPLGGNMYALFPWVGSYAFLAMERFIRIRMKESVRVRGFSSARPYFMTFSTDASPDEFISRIKEEAAKPIDPMELVFPNEVPVFDKYDELLPVHLVKKGFARGVLDVVGMKERILGW